MSNAELMPCTECGERPAVYSVRDSNVERSDTRWIARCRCGDFGYAHSRAAVIEHWQLVQTADRLGITNQHDAWKYLCGVCHRQMRAIKQNGGDE